MFSKDSLRTHIFPFVAGIEKLFGQPLFSVSENRSEWLKANPEVGFRRGSSVVIEGPPGSGKTAATLALCRSVIPDQAQRLYYLSSEMTEQRVRNNHEGFGWFGKNDKIFKDINVFFADLPRARMDRPLPNSSDLMNDIFRGISVDQKRQNGRNSSPVPETCLIVVDSLSGLLRDASTPGERRRLTEDLLDRLKAEFKTKLGLVFLLTESPTLQSSETPIEHYVSDYVFRLGYKEVAGGLRIRTWDVVKSHGTFMEPGVHTWGFLTEETCDKQFLSKEFSDFVWEYSGSESERATSGENRSGSIVIYPQWASYLTRDNDNRLFTPEAYGRRKIWSGTPGLDELLLGDTEYWSRVDKWKQSSEGSKWTPGLTVGDTTLLLGASGTLKTWLSVQFLAGAAFEDGLIATKPLTRDSLSELISVIRERILTETKLPSDSPLFKRFSEVVRQEVIAGRVSNDNKGWKKCVKDFSRQWLIYRSTLFISFEGESPSLAGFTESSKELKPLVRDFIYVAPASLHFNRLLFEVKWLCSARKVQRVVIDGLGDLMKCVDATSRVGIATALLNVVREEQYLSSNVSSRPTIFVTYELSPGTTASTPDSEGISAICDNVIALCQIRLHDQMHKAAWVLKAKNRQHDHQVREVIFNAVATGHTPGIRIQSGFEGYTDILTGKPSPAQISLRLFHENVHQRQYNRFLIRELNKRSEGIVSLIPFSQTDVTQLLSVARGALGQIPATDTTLITLDEWWLRDIQKPLQLPKSQEKEISPQQFPLLKLDGFFSLQPNELNQAKLFPLQQQRSIATKHGLASEHWITEVEKGISIFVRPKTGSPSQTIMDSSDVATSTTSSIQSSNVKLDIALNAMPYYTDFGLFCVNKRVALKKKAIAKTAFKNRKNLVASMPSVWAIPVVLKGIPWFEPPSLAKKKSTIADMLYIATDEGVSPENGFSFDSPTGETSACFLMELAWSYGVTESFLSEAAIRFAIDKRAKNSEAEGLKSALRLLQYLVFHGLMPPAPVASPSSALLSRQWYSTINTQPTKPAAKMGVIAPASFSSDDKFSDDRRQEIPIPFFPIGIRPDCANNPAMHAIHDEMLDIAKHLSGIVRRVISAMKWILDYRIELARSNTLQMVSEFHSESVTQIETTLEKVGQLQARLLKEIREPLEIDLRNDFKNCSDWHSMIPIFRELVSSLMLLSADPNAAMTSRQLRWEEGNFETENIRDSRWLPAAMAMDVRDIRQMLGWVDVRLAFIESEMEIPFNNPRLPNHLRGFACSGSWMLGVLKNTFSPALSWKLIEEMTSLRGNLKRARKGVGIPTRKDFYEVYGKTTVPRISSRMGLTWSEFLTQAGAKVRRRDRAVCNKVRLEQLTAVLRAQMSRCIDVAFQLRENQMRLSADWSEAPTSEALDMMNRTVEKATELILVFIASEQAVSHDGMSECNERCCTCPRSYRNESGNDCGATLRKRK